MEGMKVSKERGELDYQKIKDDLVKLFEAIANKLEREWDPRYLKVDSARTTFFQSMRIAMNTFNTIMFIANDISQDHDRKPSFALSLPPLTRTLFEQLIIFLFLIEDIPTYIPWMYKTAYTENRIQLEHYLTYHGTDPIWDAYIQYLKADTQRLEQDLQLTPDEIRDPQTHIRRWQTPGGFLRKLRKEHPASPAIPYMEYINSWFYRVLSGQTHLNVAGLVERGIVFDSAAAKDAFGSSWEERTEEHLNAFRVNQLYAAITLMLAIASEIEAHFNYGRNRKARYLWAYFSQHSDMVKDFWEMRYKDLLPE